MKYYVYTLSENDTIFYIGKGSGNRMYRHLQKVKRGSTTQNPHLDNKLKKLLEQNTKITYNKVFESNNEGLTYQKEFELIKEIGLDNLCNLKDGGLGGVSPTEDTRAKISSKKKGKSLSEGHKQKLREAKLGSKQSQETKDKRSKALKGKPQTEKQKEANSKRGRKGVPLSEEHKQKLREAKLKNPTKYWEGKKLPQETKDKISAKLKRSRE